MLSNEIGMQEILQKIFNLKSVEDIVDDENFDAANIEYASLCEIGYDKIVKYLNGTNNISNEMLIGLHAFFAYGHPTDAFSRCMKEHLRQYGSNLVDLLESIPDQGTSLNLQNAQYYQGIYKQKLSFSLLENVSRISLYRHRIYKGECLFAFAYLLLNAFKSCNKDFEAWFLSTKREDLKTIFTEQALDLSAMYDYIDESHISSKLPFIKVLSYMLSFKIDPQLSFPDDTKEMSEMDVSVENLYFIAYAFKYRGNEAVDQNKAQQIFDELDALKEYLQLFNVNLYKEFLGKVDSAILYLFVFKVDDEDLKTDLFSALADYLIDKIDNEEYFSYHTIKDTELLGNLLEFISEAYRITLSDKFSKLCDEIDHPYYYYRFNDNWNNEVKTLVYYLSVFFIYSQMDNDFNMKEKQERFNETVKGFIRYTQDDIKKVLNKIQRP